MASPKIYQAGKNYIISYADKNGKTKQYKITPEEDLSVAKMITKCKSENKDYIKLVDIKEENKKMKKESKLQEDIQKNLYDYLDEKNFEDIDITDNEYADMMVAFCLDPELGDTGDDYDQYLVKLAKELKVANASDNTVTVNMTEYVRNHFEQLEGLFDVAGNSKEEEEEYLVVNVMPGIISGYTTDSVYKELNNMKVITESAKYDKYKDPEVKIETKEDLSMPVKEWFVMFYTDNPDEMDDMINDVKDDLTFQDVLDALNNGEDIYDTLGVGDSVVREEVFNALCEITGLDYDVFYYKWLYGGKDKNDDTLTENKRTYFDKLDYDDDTFGSLVEIENRATLEDMKKIADEVFLEEISTAKEFWDFLLQEKPEDIRKIQKEYFPELKQESKLNEDEDENNDKDEFNELEDIDQEDIDAEDELEGTGEDQTQTQLDVEEAISEVEDPSQEDELAVNVANSSIDVLLADEESAIEGYKAFLAQVKENLLPPLYDVLEKEINEIIADEEDHINKLNTIKEGFHLEDIPLDESKEIKTENTESDEKTVSLVYGGITYWKGTMNELKENETGLKMMICDQIREEGNNEPDIDEIDIVTDSEDRIDESKEIKTENNEDILDGLKKADNLEIYIKAIPDEELKKDLLNQYDYMMNAAQPTDEGMKWVKDGIISYTKKILDKNK